MDFVRAVIDACSPLMPVKESNDSVIRHAHAAVHLQGLVDDLLHDVGHKELDE